MCQSIQHIVSEKRKVLSFTRKLKLKILMHLKLQEQSMFDGCKMLIIICISLLLCITLFIFSPSILLAKQICIEPSGCKIEMDTGLCPNCIEVDEEQPIIKEEKVIVEKKPVVKVSNPPLYPRVNESLGNKVKTNKKKGVCYVEPCSWLKTSSLVSQSKDRKPITRGRNWVGTLFKCIVGCKVGC